MTAHRGLIQALVLWLIHTSALADMTLSHGVESLMRDDIEGLQISIAQLPSPTRELFSLHAKVLDLSWDESRQSLRDDIVILSRDLQAFCDHRKNMDAVAICGQAHFALAYVQGLEGKLFLSSTNAKKAINLLEMLLEREPDRFDERLFLGLLYYYTENLPPFVRSVGRVLRLVPKTPTGAGKPMIRSVALSASDLSGPATFVWADVLAQGNSVEKTLAIDLFSDLANQYPDNFRFFYNKVEAQILNEQFSEALVTINAQSLDGLDESHRSLVHVLSLAALLGSGEKELATESYYQVSVSALPAWSHDYFWQLEQELGREVQVPVVASF